MKVVIGISGGVDSAVTAYMLKEKGYECVGVTLYLFDYRSSNGARIKPDFLEDGKRVCDQLGIDHVVLDMRDVFEKVVIEDFKENYEKGWTPNPCLVCNPNVKYQALLNYADKIGADFIATGHYAKIVKSNNRLTIERPKAVKKDQSYPLAGLKQDQLSRILWPLGEMESKDAIRALAKEVGLVVSDKKDSWGICFIEKGDFKGYLDYLYPSEHLGRFIDTSGRDLGIHKGTHHYTIGQKRNLGIDGKYTVLDIDGQNKGVVLGEDDECYHLSLVADDFSGMVWTEPKLGQKCIAKVCQWGYELEAEITKCDDETFEVSFNEPVRAITLGQRVVLYQDNMILASGRIIKKEK